MTFHRAKALAEYYAENGWRTQALTITYIEDFDPGNWKPLPTTHNAFNDVRLLWIPKEEKIILNCIATTEPGIPPTQTPLNPNGAFRIQLETLFKECWELGRHVTRSSNQKALIQIGSVSGHRDLDKNGYRTGDRVFSGWFGINQHTTGDYASTPPPARGRVGWWSAGCLVGWHPSTHYNRFIPPLEESGIKKFDTVVINGSKFYQFLIDKGYVQQ